MIVMSMLPPAAIVVRLTVAFVLSFLTNQSYAAARFVYTPNQDISGA